MHSTRLRFLLSVIRSHDQEFTHSFILSYYDLDGRGPNVEISIQGGAAATDKNKKSSSRCIVWRADSCLHYLCGARPARRSVGALLNNAGELITSRDGLTEFTWHFFLLIFSCGLHARSCCVRPVSVTSLSHSIPFHRLISADWPPITPESTAARTSLCPHHPRGPRLGLRKTARRHGSAIASDPCVCWNDQTIGVVYYGSGGRGECHPTPSVCVPNTSP